MASAARREAGRKLSRRSRRLQPRPTDDEDDREGVLTDRHVVLLRNLQLIHNEEHKIWSDDCSGWTVFREVVYDEYKHQVSDRRKGVIQKGAVAFLKGLQDLGSTEEKRRYLTTRGAKYALSTEENRKLSRELLIYNIAEDTEAAYQEERQRQLNTCSTDPECLAFAAACSSSASSSSSIIHQQQPSSSFFDDLVSAFSEDVREEHERRVQNVLQNDVLPDRIGSINLTEAQLEILSRSEYHAFHLTFKRLLSHFAVWSNSPLLHITALLKLINANKCVINYKDLPTTAAGLLKVNTALIAPTSAIKPIRWALVPGRPKVVTGHYLHFGIEHALRAKSCGLLKKWQYLMTMRTVLAIFPELVPPEIRLEIGPQPGEEYDMGLLKHWYSLPPPPDQTNRRLVLLMHGHTDGVNLYQNSVQSKGVPILGTLVGIVDEQSGESVKIPTLDPFLIGALKSATSKTNTKKFTKDFVKELVRLGDRTKSGLSYTVKLICMICDTPQRAECKGITSFMGYFACERCVVRGIKPPGGMMKFPDLDKRLRKDEHWPRYLEESDDPKFLGSNNTKVYLYIYVKFMLFVYLKL